MHYRCCRNAAMDLLREPTQYVYYNIVIIIYIYILKLINNYMCQ